MRLPRRLGGVVHRGGLSGGNAVPPISSLGTVEGARPAVLETLRTGMVQSRLLRRLGLLAALAAGYFVAGKLGLEVAYVHPSATAVWPPSGLDRKSTRLNSSHTVISYAVFCLKKKKKTKKSQTARE